tara:strand:- start:1166 stop:2341 length:1176 start_codon:yes stop_codon:yes gene_type:complete
MLGLSYIENMYKNHIKELLFNEEKTLIPLSMITVQKNKIIKEVIIEKNKLEKEYTNISHTMDTFDRIKLDHEIKAHSVYITHLKSKPIEKNTKIQYKYPCGKIDCNGFVNNQWKCEICDKSTCKYCFKIKEENHECSKDDVDTAELIKKDSKPCPKCNISIMKTSGCDQMWCTSCHTAFDWKSLKIVTKGIIHNPEYFKYMREHNITIARNPNDNPCANLLYDSYLKIINRKKELNKILSNTLIIQLYELYRRIQHCELVSLHSLIQKVDVYDNWKDNERVRFLEKEITEKQYKTNLARKFKDIDYINEVIVLQRTIFEVSKETYIKVVTNIIENIEIYIKNNSKIDTIDELVNLQKFINTINDIEFLKIQKIYNRSSKYKLYNPCNFTNF